MFLTYPCQSDHEWVTFCAITCSNATSHGSTPYNFSHVIFSLLMPRFWSSFARRLTWARRIALCIARTSLTSAHAATTLIWFDHNTLYSTDPPNALQHHPHQHPPAASIPSSYLLGRYLTVATSHLILPIPLSTHSNPSNPSLCSYYVLVISWPSSFIQTPSQQVSCLVSQSYQKSSLAGLWPACSASSSHLQSYTMRRGAFYGCRCSRQCPISSRPFLVKNRNHPGPFAPHFPSYLGAYLFIFFSGCFRRLRIYNRLSLQSLRRRESHVVVFVLNRVSDFACQIVSQQKQVFKCK